jgi:hypothetical protein
MASLNINAQPLPADGLAKKALVGDGALRRHFNPSRETLWAKIAGLEQSLRMLREVSPELLEQCWANLEAAKACIDHGWGHSHLAWRFLHRVDEDLLLAFPDVQLYARALDVRVTFELNVTEPTTRGEWLGTAKEKGRLSEVIERVSAAQGEGISHLAERHLLREALRTVNDRVDRGFWVLSMNVLTTVWSGVLLGVLMVGLAGLWRWTSVSDIASLGSVPARDLALVLVFGAMGAYVGNLLTRRDFLFVQGGPFIRYLLHPLLTKPILGAFAACVVYVVARSGIVFGIGKQAAGGEQGFALSVPAGALGYVHAVLALASGFAADKVLGDMIGSVLRRLEQKAEKTTKPKEEPAT